MAPVAGRLGAHHAPSRRPDRAGDPGATLQPSPDPDRAGRSHRGHPGRAPGWLTSPGPHNLPSGLALAGSTSLWMSRCLPSEVGNGTSTRDGRSGGGVGGAGGAGGVGGVSGGAVHGAGRGTVRWGATVRRPAVRRRSLRRRAARWGVAGRGRGRVAGGGVVAEAEGGQAALAARSVLVHVLLARQLHELVHDLVGYRPEDQVVVLQAVVAGEVQRLAEPHARP